MTKRFASLLLTAALGMAAAQTSVTTVNTSTIQSSTIPADPRLKATPISMNTGYYVGPLSPLLSGIAKSAGYDVLFNFNVDALPLIVGAAPAPATGQAAAPAGAATAPPTGVATNYASPVGKPLELLAKPIVLSFSSQPFNQVWPLLMDLYELRYEVVQVGSREVIRVYQRSTQLVVNLENITATAALSRLDEFLGDPYFETVRTRDDEGKIVERDVFAGYKLDPQKLRAVIADGVSNRLIISGLADEIRKAQEFLDTIDDPSAKLTQASQINDRRIYTARGALADVVSVLAAQYPTLKVTPVGNTGQLVISGPQDQVTAALELLATVDRPTITPASQRVYTAKGAASDVVSLLTAQYPALKATPVGNTGQLVISGPQDQLTAALELLATVDRAPATVVSTADVQPVQSVYNVKGGQDDAVAVLSAQYPGLKVTPVGKTGQLVINGPKNQVDAALALLATVDRALAQSPATIQRLFQLINADAEEIKVVLLGQAEQARTSVTTTTGTGTGVRDTTSTGVTTPTTTSTSTTDATTQQSVTRDILAAAQAGLLTENPPTIIADKRTNTLIVRGTPEQVEQIAQLIPQLDQKVPQINVQVRIQEITEKASRSLGVDWNLGFSGFRITAGTGGLSAAFDPTKTLQGFNIGPTLRTLEGQGLAKSVYDGTVTMQSGQRSLGSSTDTQNASSSAAATIKQGGRLEINIPSTSGNIQKQIDYGVNLDFFNPQVAPDGTITMRVRGQVNNLSTTIDADTIPNLLQFTNSEAQTTLTFKSGETLLLSGLLANKETSNNDGVPFLASIPVVGGLFGTQRTATDKAQLLVIITGTVVK